MLQHVRCSTFFRGTLPSRQSSANNMVKRARSQGSFCITTTATTTTANAAAAAASKRTTRDVLFFFSGRRHGRVSAPTLAGVSAAVAMMGGVAVACMAVASSTSPSAAVSAAESTSKHTYASGVSEAAGEGEKEEEWKENASLVAAAHELRRALTPPHQSLFRVVCILVYEDSAGNLHRVTGTNAEATTIGGSICAERAAMCKLREASDCKCVTKVVVVTDNPGPLAPGVLCREFLSAHIPPSTPVVMSGSGYDRTSSSSSFVPGGLLYDEEERSGLMNPSPENAVVPSATAAAAAAAAEGGNGKGSNVSLDDSANAGAAGATTTTSRATAAVVVAGGPEPEPEPKPEPAVASTCDRRGNTRAIASATAESGRDEELYEEAESGGARGGKNAVDVCTVGDLYPWGNMYGVTGRGEQLRLGFLRQQGAEELSKPGLAERLGLDSGVLEAYDAAWRATAEDNRDGVHPIRYAAVALFPDGEAEITHQLKALEYGATLDPVTLLAPAMMRRAKDGVRPSWVVLTDQFGLVHAPFAQARTFLTEHGFGETKIVIHGEDGAVVVVKAKDLVPRVTTAR